jgi:hypothetical protein
MDQNSEKYIGYLKYSGKSVENGLLDVRKSAEALLGFDEILRYFLLKEDPSLSEIEFEIPVRIRKGSWEALIPEIIDKIFSIEGVATIYATATATKAAKDGLFETGIAKDVKKTFQGALITVQWIIRIATHIGGFIKNRFENEKIIQEDQEVYIEIFNQENKSLKVPKKYADLFINCPERIFAKNAKIIETERILEFGVFDQDKETKVVVSEKEKYIFYNQDENEDIVLPELKHGQFVELEGEITRATESTNSIGFRYQDHTLVCKPISGNIAQYKNNIISSEDDHFFPKVQIKGQVDRTDKNGEFKEKKPQIFFSEVLPLITEKPQISLF